MCYFGACVRAIVVFGFYFSFDISFDIIGVGTRGRYKCDCESSHNVGFNGAVTRQTVPAKILATQLFERLGTKKTTEIGQD
jgi:hypothetical protein